MPWSLRGFLLLWLFLGLASSSLAKKRGGDNNGPGNELELFVRALARPPYSLRGDGRRLSATMGELAGDLSQSRGGSA